MKIVTYGFLWWHRIRLRSFADDELGLEGISLGGFECPFGKSFVLLLEGIDLSGVWCLVHKIFVLPVESCELRMSVKDWQIFSVLLSLSSSTSSTFSHPKHQTPNTKHQTPNTTNTLWHSTPNYISQRSSSQFSLPSLILSLFDNVVYSAAIDTSPSSCDVNVTEAADFAEFGDIVANALPDGRHRIDFYTNGVLDGSTIETEDGGIIFHSRAA